MPKFLNAFSAAVTAIALSAGGAIASTTNFFLGYDFDSDTALTATFNGTLTGNILTVDNVQGTITRTGFADFVFDTALGGFFVSGNFDSDPASFSVDGSSFDVAIIGLPSSNVCSSASGFGFCLLGSFVSVNTPDGGFASFTFDPANVSLPPVPLPASLALLAGGLGLFGVAGLRRRARSAVA